MEFSTLADRDTIQTTIERLNERNVQAEFLRSGAKALQRIKDLIPEGASVSTAASLTLRDIGLESILIEKKHPWNNLKDRVVAETDPVKQASLRRQSIMADYFLGSVHAITTDGEIVIASATGSQLAPYGFSSQNVIWVVGAQKIVTSIEEGIRRVEEYIFPHEDERMREITNGARGSVIGRLMIFRHEPDFLRRTVRLLLVNEIVGD